MLKQLKEIFHNSKEKTSDTILDENLPLLCGLMLEAAQIDGQIDQGEINKIKSTLINIFNEDPKETDLVLQSCLKEIDQPKSLHAFTSKINKVFSDEKKNYIN